MYPSLSDSQKKQLFGAFMGVLIVLIIFLAIKGVNAIKEYSYIGRGVYAANVISVNGTADVFAVPDVAKSIGANGLYFSGRMAVSWTISKALSAVSPSPRAIRKTDHMAVFHPFSVCLSEAHTVQIFLMSLTTADAVA